MRTLLTSTSKSGLRLSAVLLVFACALAHRAAAGDALGNYDARLREISRSYNQQFSEIRRNRRSDGPGKIGGKSAEQAIRQLAKLRSEAISEAKRIYELERKQEAAGPSDKPSRTQSESDQWTAQQRAAEDGQKMFWAKVGRADAPDRENWEQQLRAAGEGQNAFWSNAAWSETNDAELWALQIQTVEDGQRAFWAQFFPALRTPSSEGRLPKRPAPDLVGLHQRKPATGEVVRAKATLALAN